MKYFDIHTEIPASRLAATVCLSLLLGACALGGESAPAANTPDQASPSQNALPTREPLSQAAISADGALALSAPTVSLTFEGSGKITSVRVTLGQAVKKGSVLATIDDTELRDAVVDAQFALRQIELSIRQQYAPPSNEDLAAAQASLRSASAAYTVTKAGKTQSELESARRSWESAWLQYLNAQIDRDVHCGGPDGVAAVDCKMKEANYGNAYESMLAAKTSYEKTKEPVAKESLIQAQSSVVSARAKLDSLSAPVAEEMRALNDLQLAQAKSALARAQAKLSKATLVSPCDCIVQAVNIGVGAASGGAAMVLVDPSKLQFRTSNLAERDVVALKPGASVSIRLKAHAEAIDGTVAAVLAQSSGTQSGSALYTVLIDVEPGTLKLLPGMTGQAEIAIP